ncbi:Protein of unknown function [Actinopolyspora xinjiangensis]|uniref:DUF3558 domain-containing protein n=1 Tax=Actinopolyspora xinjiangensis TaxID=405564 RepID=A0A1H0VPE2_9ACTN|nr:DUF3558 family protein [Actinopolyspora xinjiangensis]SDP80310.1 Protein of unknown function [Actinopolyspora xinjiangensis]
MRKTTAISLVTAALLIGGCGYTSQDQGVDNLGSESTPQSSTSRDSPTENELEETDPCSLLSKKQQEELGVRVAGKDTSGPTRSCDFQTPAEASEIVTVGTSIRTEQSLSDFTDSNGKPVDDTISGRNVKIACKYGNCLIGISVDENSRVDVQGSIIGRESQNRNLATNVARMVIGNLPRQ